MNKKLLIGIDVGTTVLKAAAFDAQTGALVRSEQSALKVICYSQGSREYPPNSLPAALALAMRRLKSALGGRWKKVEGIGVAAQGGSATIADKQSGYEKMPMFLWNDSRSLVHLHKIASFVPMSYWKNRTMSGWVPWGLGRILWLRQNMPELLDASRNIYVGAGEIVFFFLTRRWRQDAGNALQIGCYNVRRRALDADMLGLVELPLSFVSPMREGNETAALAPEPARILDLKAGIPVAGPYMDHEAGYLSCVGCGSMRLQISLGTAWVGNYIASENARWSSPSQLVLPSPLDKGWLIVQPLRTGNISWDWALQSFVGGGRSAFLKADRLFLEQPLPPPGLVAFPWLTCNNFFAPAIHGAGCFHGVNPSTRPSDMLRAVAAGMCCEMARVFRPLQTEGWIKRMVLSGGASKGVGFRVMLGSLFSPLQIFVPRNPDITGAKGSLYAFGIPMADFQMLSRSADEFLAQAGHYYEQYNRVFRRLFGDQEDLAAISVKHKRAGRL